MEEEVTEDKIIQPKANFIIRYYIVSSFIVVYILNVLSHLLAVNVSTNLQYFGNIGTILGIIFVMYYSMKNEANAKMGKKILNIVVSFVVAILVLGLAQNIAKRSILGIQDKYVQKQDIAWSSQLKVFASENDLSDLTNKELEQFVTQDYYNNFEDKFKSEHTFLFMFMIQKNLKGN